MSENSGCLLLIGGALALGYVAVKLGDYRDKHWTDYHVATIYCPNAPPLKLDSVSWWFRDSHALYVQGRPFYERRESPSCTARWGKP